MVKSFSNYLMQESIYKDIWNMYIQWWAKLWWFHATITVKIAAYLNFKNCHWSQERLPTLGKCKPKPLKCISVKIMEVNYTIGLNGKSVLLHMKHTTNNGPQ